MNQAAFHDSDKVLLPDLSVKEFSMLSNKPPGLLKWVGRTLLKSTHLGTTVQKWSRNQHPG